MSDFSKKQPKPQGRTDSDVATEKKAAGTPVTGFTEAPRGQGVKGGPGEGIPANNRKIH